METNFIRLMAQAREAKRQLQQEGNVSAYFQVLYQNIFKSGKRFPRVSQFIEEISKDYNLQNKVLISRATADLALPDDQGKLIVIKDSSLKKDDWLFKSVFNLNSLVIHLNTHFPAPKVNDSDLTHYEEEDVSKTADILVLCGYYLEQSGDKLMTRVQFKQSTGQA